MAHLIYLSISFAKLIAMRAVELAFRQNSCDLSKLINNQLALSTPPPGKEWKKAELAFFALSLSPEVMCSQ